MHIGDTVQVPIAPKGLAKVIDMKGIYVTVMWKSSMGGRTFITTRKFDWRRYRLAQHEEIELTLLGKLYYYITRKLMYHTELKDESLMLIGREHLGKPLRDVPATYLLWYREHLIDKRKKKGLVFLPRFEEGLIEYVKENEEILIQEKKDDKIKFHRGRK